MNENELKLDRYEEEIAELRRALGRILSMASSAEDAEESISAIHYVADDALFK